MCIRDSLITQAELESLISALTDEIESDISSIYSAAEITTSVLSLYLQNRVAYLYNASYSDYYKHESALTDTSYYVRAYVRYNFNIYNNVEASFEKAYRTLNEGFNVIIVLRSGVDNIFLNSSLVDFKNRINETRDYFNAYLNDLLGREFYIDTTLRYKITNELKRLNLTVYNISCDNISTFVEMNACLVKTEKEYSDLLYDVVWLVNELNDLRNNTVDKGKITYQTEYGKLITYRNGLLEAQYVSYNITVADVNDWATNRINATYTDGYNKYIYGYYPSVQAVAKVLFDRNDLLNLMSSGVTIAQQNLQNATQALKLSLIHI